VGVRLERRDEAIGSEREHATRRPQHAPVLAHALPHEPGAPDLRQRGESEQHQGPDDGHETFQHARQTIRPLPPQSPLRPCADRPENPTPGLAGGGTRRISSGSPVDQACSVVSIVTAEPRAGGSAPEPRAGGSPPARSLKGNGHPGVPAQVARSSQPASNAEVRVARMVWRSAILTSISDSLAAACRRNPASAACRAGGGPFAGGPRSHRA
jgi:hypothetical protein